MKLFYLATVLFAALVGIAQVSAKGYYCTKHIVIQHGDRCYMIYGYDKHKEYYVRPKDLRILNPTMDCDNLRSGQKVCVDVNIDKSPEYDDYYIKRGDTCKSIAKKLNTTVQVLKNINNYLQCDKDNLNEQIDVRISYRKDGKYAPNFKNSKRVNIIN